MTDPPPYHLSSPACGDWAIITTMSRFPDGVQAASSGCYDATRAAALSGVPRSTVYDWARKGVVIPTVSPVQEKLWSYVDLIALRVVAWLRRPKTLGSDVVLPASPMRQVRGALSLLPEFGVDMWAEETRFGDSPLLVDQRGAIFLRVPDGIFDLQGNRALPHKNHFGLLGPFDAAGQRGPNLLRPRPNLRIVPAKVAGEPHVKSTRLTTPTLAALVRRGFSCDAVAEMYEVPVDVVCEAVDLERELSGEAA